GGAILHNGEDVTHLGMPAMAKRSVVRKCAAFTLPAALSGLAGSTKAIVSRLASLTGMHWSMSGEVLLMTFLGGAGRVLGPVVGAFTLVGMQNYLAGLGQWVTVIHASIFAVYVLAFRRGIVGGYIAWWYRRQAFRARKGVPATVPVVSCE